MLRHIKRPRRGTSLIELAFASVIFLAVMGATLSLFVYMLTEEKSNTARLNMTQEVSALHRQLRQVAANGANILVSGGDIDNDRVRFRRIGGAEAIPVFSELRYVEGDNGIENSFIEFYPDRDDEAVSIVMVTGVSRIPDPANPGQFLPVFTRSPGFGAPLVVQFRVGDRFGNRLSRTERAQNANDRADDAVTGPGYQGIVFRSAYGPRNG